MVGTKIIHPYGLLFLKCYKIPAFVNVFFNDTWPGNHSFSAAGKALKFIWKYCDTIWQSAAVLLYPAFVPDTPSGGYCRCVKWQAMDGYDFNSKPEFERQSMVSALWLFVGYGLHSLAISGTDALSLMQMV